MITCYPTVLRAEQFADFSYLPFLSLSLGTRVQSFFKKSPYSFSHILEHYLSQGGDGGGMCVCACEHMIEEGILTVAFGIALNKSSSVVALIQSVAHSLLEYLCFNNNMWEGFRILIMCSCLKLLT